MKTKKDTRKRKSQVEFKVAAKDISWEYYLLIEDDIIDELAMAEVLDCDE
jgi:hypothetical protein